MTAQAEHDNRRRWLALIVVCLAMLMNVLDTTVVNVALPKIQHDLHFTQAGLAWVIDAYLVAFAGFLLISGRLGDLIGRKKVFLTGLADLHRGLGRVRARQQPGPADRRALRAGIVGSALGIGDPRDHRHRVPRSA